MHPSFLCLQIFFCLPISIVALDRESQGPMNCPCHMRNVSQFKKIKIKIGFSILKQCCFVIPSDWILFLCYERENLIYENGGQSSGRPRCFVNTFVHSLNNGREHWLLLSTLKLLSTVCLKYLLILIHFPMDLWLKLILSYIL